MRQYEMLIIPMVSVIIAMLCVLVGYWMGRRTVTDKSLFEMPHNPKDENEPELDEIERCLRER